MKKLSTIRTHFKGQFTWSSLILLTMGSLLLAVNVNLFLEPANLAPGGVSGVAILVNEFTGWPIGLVMLVLNIPLIVLGFKSLGRYQFLIRTLYVVLIYNFGVDLLAGWMPQGGITNDLLLNALYGGVLGGIGTGLVFRAQGTPGGTGILGRVLQLRTGIPVSQIYLFTDGGVVLAAALLLGWEIGLYSLITLFVWGVVVDYILEGPSVVRTAFIITETPQEVAESVFVNLKIGVTAWSAQGMYTEARRTLLFCTVGRADVNTLKELVMAVDPQAFIVIAHGHRAIGGMLGLSSPASVGEQIEQIDIGS